MLFHEMIPLTVLLPDITGSSEKSLVISVVARIRSSSGRTLTTSWAPDSSLHIR